jgi:hypothetical protein
MNDKRLVKLHFSAAGCCVFCGLPVATSPRVCLSAEAPLRNSWCGCLADAHPVGGECPERLKMYDELFPGWRDHPNSSTDGRTPR